jgi:hypothetical protein
MVQTSPMTFPPVGMKATLPGCVPFLRSFTNSCTYLTATMNSDFPETSEPALLAVI